ncbi:MAG: hypothetical protein AB1414_01205 [bacterium]
MSKQIITAEEARSEYCEKFFPNKNWKKQKYTLCLWEHCIELMPLLTEEEIKKYPVLSCPIFGHCCSGGPWQIFNCKPKLEILNKRIITRKNKKGREVIKDDN